MRIAAVALLMSLSACATHARGVTLEGAVVEPLRVDARAVVLFFVSTDCPISNRYAPEIQRIEHDYSTRGVSFSLVYVDPNATPESLRGHLVEYGFPPHALRDPWRELARAADVTITPEAAVFLRGRRVYHGRIDNRFATLGVQRPAPTQRELIAVLNAVIAGRPVTTADTPAVGCYLPASR